MGTLDPSPGGLGRQNRAGRGSRQKGDGELFLLSGGGESREPGGGSGGPLLLEAAASPLPISWTGQLPKEKEI